MLDTPSKVLRFDKFGLDLARCAIFKGDEQLALRRQSFDVLRHLAEHSGEVVPRDALMKAVWAVAPARPEDSLFQCIKDIRRALGDEARWIVRSVPGLGYQFMAEVTAVEEKRPPFSERETASPPQAAPPTAAQSYSHTEPRQWHRALIVTGLLIVILGAGGWLAWRGTRPEPPPELTMMAVPTLAVLPFEALAADLDNEARAFAEAVAAEVSRHNWGSMLRLKFNAGFHGPTTDSRVIGRQLGARYLVTGSLRREGEQNSGNFALVEAETGRQLWLKPFWYSTQEQRTYTAAGMASAIAGNVVTTESQRPLPDRLDAGHYTLRAFVLLSNQRNVANTKAAHALLEKALEVDPDWAPALVGYSWALVNEFYGRDPESIGKAERAIERAIKLIPWHSHVYERRAALLRARGDTGGAIAATEHALLLNPNLPNAHGELGRNKIDAGLPREAIAHIEQAIRIAPAHNQLHLWSWWAGQAALQMGDHEGAVGWLEKARQANPANANPVPWLAVAYAMTGREHEARTLLAEHMAKTPAFTVSGWIERFTRGNAVAKAQFAPIAEAMRRLVLP